MLLRGWSAPGPDLMKISRNRTVLCGLVDEDVSYRNCDRDSPFAPHQAPVIAHLNPHSPGSRWLWGAGSRVRASRATVNARRRPQEAVETPGDCAEALELVALPASEDAIYAFNLATRAASLSDQGIFS